MLKYNPQWIAADWAGEIPAMPRWAQSEFRLLAMFWYDEEIAFTRESWRGRIRASHGIGAVLSDSKIAAFDAEHDTLLRNSVGEHFAVRHRLDAHLLDFK